MTTIAFSRATLSNSVPVEVPFYIQVNFAPVSRNNRKEYSGQDHYLYLDLYDYEAGSGMLEDVVQ